MAAQAALSTSHRGQAEALRKSASSAQDVLALLPSPRTKLNRPFDLVNFHD
ncbi:hypothetical protein [Bailinhaonella thermotolerans]|uniref:hypothetical protein n=1 Tax=Bailinhaonella thermotolerans TaxID=1070861 RepID=UPI00192A3E4C|nr:hypothetical protein [Bailinhaonella thermotolerans]